MINKEGIVRRLVTITIIFIVVACILQVAFPIRPFWVDEWRVIYNLKFKSAEALWGPMDFMQQFPRLYLELIKAFTALFNYSYSSLRVPSLLVSCCTILLCWRLGKKIFPVSAWYALLFVVFILSSYTFTEFFVQIKQYAMDVFLSVAALWQLIALAGMNGTSRPRKRNYSLLCLSFIVLPFFSYTYPIALGPVYAVIMLQWRRAIPSRGRRTAMRLLPLCLGAVSILAFYYLDVRQLIADKGMSTYWQQNMFSRKEGLQLTLEKVYTLFAQAGPGAFFGNLIGIAGIAAFLRGIIFLVRDIKRPDASLIAQLRLYSTLLLLLTLLLFFAGKLPLAEPRLNAFTVPSIAILIIDFLNSLNQRWSKAVTGFAAVLYIGLLGNIYATLITFFTEDKYARKMEIYKATQNAIRLAQHEGCPILITSGIAYPYEGTPNFPLPTPLPGNWILKTFPAYRASDTIAVYPIISLNDAEVLLNKLPSGIREAGNRRRKAIQAYPAEINGAISGSKKCANLPEYEFTFTLPTQN